MRRLIFATPALFALVASAGLQAKEAAPPGMTRAQRADVQQVEMLTLPLPGEFFAALDKVDRPDWKAFLREEPPTPTINRAQIALALGTLVTDGYIAVEIQDGQQVKNGGAEIIDFAKKLNVGQSVVGRGNSIRDFAENHDWSALREELEATQNEVKLQMRKQKDEGLITLVSTGVWIREGEVVSSLVAKTYTPQAARLLHQPAIISYLLARLADLPETLLEDPLVASVRETLGKCLPLVTPETPSLAEIQSLHHALAALDTKIAHNPPPPPKPSPTPTPSPSPSPTPPPKKAPPTPASKKP